MSNATAPPSMPGLRAGDVLAMLIVVGLAAGLGWFMLRDREVPLRRSAMGHDGLIAWLKSGDVEARQASGMPVAAGTTGLRILPLHDTDLSAVFERPQDPAAFLATATEIDVTRDVALRKIALAPTLVVAPKWTRAVRHSGHAHATLLLDGDEAARPFRQLGLMGGAFVRPRARLLELPANLAGGGDLAATLYAPQLFAPPLAPGCVSVIGGSAGHLLVRCESGAGPVHALSDPDLLNNHGLSLGRNAALARAVIARLSNGGPVLVDTTQRVFIAERPADPAQREWSDLLRFLRYPMSILWAGLALVTALSLWRSATRFGPPRRLDDDRQGASKSVSIAAKARLLRMTGNDRRLFDSHVRSRLRRLERQLFGSDTAHGDPARRIFGLVDRRNPALARDFARAATAALTQSAGAPVARLVELAETLETETRKVLDEFGRTPHAG